MPMHEQNDLFSCQDLFISKNRIRTENRSFHCKKIEARTKGVLIMGAIKNSRSVRTNGKQSLFLQLVIPGQGSRGPIILWVGLEPLKQKTGSSRRLAPLALAASLLIALRGLSNLLAPPARAFLSPTTHLNSIASHLLRLTSHRISSTHIGTHLTASPAAPNGGRPTPVCPHASHAPADYRGPSGSIRLQALWQQQYL
jgi:hypothetical protein